MPVYEFQCSNDDCECNVHIEKEISITKAAELECPFCGENMSKVYSSVGVVFKGSGFYSTDK